MEKETTQHIRVPLKWHLIGWVLLISLYYVFLITVLKESFGNEIDFAFFIIFNILIFYFNVIWLLPKSTREVRKAPYRVPFYLFFELIGLLFLFTLISLGLGGLSFNTIEKPYGIFILNFFQMLFPFSYGLFLSLVYYAVLLGIKQKRAKENVKRENERLIHEVEINRQNFLKAQLNPHLFFNILPMLRYTMVHSPEKATEILIILNRMMRYYLRKTSNGLIPLVDEINQVQRLMTINNMRWGESCKVYLTASGNNQDLQIIPMVLLLLVENMYKYGVLDDKQQPATLEIKVMDGTLLISAKNVIKDVEHVTSTGTGLRNLQERLEYFYPNRHLFKVDTKENLFIVYLRIQSYYKSAIS